MNREQVERFRESPVAKVFAIVAKTEGRVSLDALEWALSEIVLAFLEETDPEDLIRRLGRTQSEFQRQQVQDVARAVRERVEPVETWSPTAPQRSVAREFPRIAWLVELPPKDRGWYFSDPHRRRRLVGAFEEVSIEAWTTVATR